jgi:hypothetical protein
MLGNRCNPYHEKRGCFTLISDTHTQVGDTVWILVKESLEPVDNSIPTKVKRMRKIEINGSN